MRKTKHFTLLSSFSGIWTKSCICVRIFTVSKINNRMIRYRKCHGFCYFGFWGLSHWIYQQIQYTDSIIISIHRSENKMPKLVSIVSRATHFFLVGIISTPHKKRSIIIILRKYELMRRFYSESNTITSKSQNESNCMLGNTI